MSNQAGPGPFVLVYHVDQAEYLCGPDSSPCTAHFWPWDRPLPGGWAVCRFTVEHGEMPMGAARRGESGVVVDEPEWQDDEERLAAQARCKDMAYTLKVKLGQLVSEPRAWDMRDITKLAEQLYEKLPGGA